MLRVISCHLFSHMRLQDELEKEFYADHGVTFKEFIEKIVLNRSPYDINWGCLNPKWDFAIIDLHKFTVKAIVKKTNDSINIRDYMFHYYL